MLSRRWCRLSLVLVTVLLGCIALAETGFIQVRAQPGVQVFLDDMFVGVTNADVGGLILTEVRIGERRLRFVRDGFLPQEATVPVGAGQVLLYEVGSLIPRVQVREEGAEGAAELRRETGTVVVQCLPIECVVDIPELGITNRRKTQDRLVLEDVPVGQYEAQLSVGTIVLPVSVGVCMDDLITVFATFVGLVPGVEVWSQMNMAWPACDTAHVLLVPAAVSLLPGETVDFVVLHRGLGGGEEFLWSTSGGILVSDGDTSSYRAPEESGVHAVNVSVASNPQWKSWAEVYVAPFAVSSFAVVHAPLAKAGDPVAFTWLLRRLEPTPAAMTLECILFVESLEGRDGAFVQVLDSCDPVNVAPIQLPFPGMYSASLLVTDAIDDSRGLVLVTTEFEH